ncbi:MAG: histidine phosphatase family protein [Bryobacterales bacterium]|nr:histidine phosphatase family protein [Bryobacterales bacterium]
MPRLFLIRHGEPELKGTLLGRRDPGLSAEGRIAAGAAMAGIDAAVAYVSPLRRARETAAFLPPGIRRIITGGLIEIGLGEWEGLEWREVEARWPDVARRKLERWFDVPAPGGETWPRVAARAARVIERIRAGPFPAAVVAHLGINSAIIARLTGSDPRMCVQGYCEILTYDI